MLKAAAAVARDTGCTVELPVKGGGVVRIIPPVDSAPEPAPILPRKWGQTG